MAEPKIKYDIEAAVSGTASVDTLEKTLRGLAGTLDGDLKTKALSAADALKALGEKQQAIETFRALKLESGQVGQALNTADRELQALAGDLRTAQASTQAMTSAQAAAAQVVADTKNKLAEQRAALVQLRTDYTGAARGTDEYKNANSQLRTTIADLRISLKQKNDELKTDVASAKAAEQSERALTAEYERAQSATRRLSADLGDTNRALDASRTALKALGVEGTGLAQTQKALGAAEAGLRTQVDDLARALKNSAATAAAAKAAADEMRESDRLLSIQAKAAEEQAVKGRNALLAEIAAQHEAEAQTRKTTAAATAAAAEQQRLATATAAAKQAASDAADKWQRDAFAIVEAAEAAAKAKRAADLLTEAERFLAAETARSTIAQQAAAAEQKRLAEAAAAAATALKNAYSTVGVRSAQELQSEIARVRAAMDTIRTSSSATGAGLQSAFAAGNAKIKELELSLRQIEGTLTLTDKARAAFSTGMGQITGGNLIANGIGYLVGKVSELGAAFWKSNTELESTRRALDAIYKNSATAAGQLDFLRRTADSAGVSAGSLSRSFIGFSAATKSAGIPLETTNALFSSVTKAGATLGLSTDRVSLALQALSQMASKGTVQMEELRGQLSENLPGSLSLVAKGLGLTELQLVNLVGAGKLAARDLFPALAESLKSMEGDTNTAAGSWERFKNALDLSLTNLGDSGGMAVLTLSLRTLAAVLGVIVVPIAAFIEIIFGSAKAVGVLAGALTTLSNPLDALKEIFGGAAGRVEALTESFASAAGMSIKHADALGASTEAMRAGAQAAAAAAAKMANATTAIQANAAATDGAALAQKIMADSTTGLNEKWVQLGVLLGEVVVAQEKQVTVSEKLAAAAKIEGDSIVALTKLRGNDADTLQAEIAAAEKNVVALSALTSARNQGLATLQSELTQKLALIAGNEKESTARAKDITEIRAKVSAMEAETIASRNALEAAKNEATARRIALDAYKDNALAVASSRVALEKAMQVEADYIRLEKEGMISKEAVTDATRRRTQAEALYKDALSDSIRLESARASAQQSELQLQQSGYTLLQAQAEAEKQRALRLGNEYAYTQAVIKQKEIDIKLIELRYTTLMAEATGIMAVSNATRAELEAKGQLTEVQRLTIENSIRSAEIKLTEAEATKAGVTELKKQLESLKTGNQIRDEWNSKTKTNTASTVLETAATQLSTEAIKARADAFEKMMMRYTLSADYSEHQIALLEAENALVERRNALERERLNIDKEGYSLNTAGQRVIQEIQTQRSIYENAKSQGLTEEQALKLSNETALPYNGKSVTAGTRAEDMDGSTWSTKLQKKIDELVLANASTNANSSASATAAAQSNAASTPQPAVTPAAAPAAQPTPATNTYVTNITIPGSAQKTISMTDAASAINLSDILSQLTTARSTAS
jgi:tape measure domain-containing protein